MKKILAKTLQIIMVLGFISLGTYVIYVEPIKNRESINTFPKILSAIVIITAIFACLILIFLGLKKVFDWTVKVLDK